MQASNRRPDDRDVLLVIDVQAGFAVTVRLEACRGIDIDSLLARALEEMRQAGVALS
ncbi:MAG TPA: hypothetical protein VFC56_20510 [Stellaceae bacterium]|nr:hypothetical protein [Stellaceae bacterium]